MVPDAAMAIRHACWISRNYKQIRVSVFSVVHQISFCIYPLFKIPLLVKVLLFLSKKLPLGKGDFQVDNCKN